MKVRIGVGLGGLQPSDDFGALVDRMEELGIDSLWLSELIYAPQLDPIVGLTHAAARTRQLKLGTGVSVLPGRHPVVVAKQLASLAWLAPGRILPAFGLQPARPAERALFPVPSGRRAAVFDESLTLVRMLLSQEKVTFAGEFFSVDDASVGLLPQRPIDLWIGGSAPAALRRIGRLADGWLASFLTPEEAAAGIATVSAAAADAGRQVDPEHFGISLAVAFGPLPDAVAASIRRRRPDVDPALLVPAGWEAARALIEQFVAAGVSKFVIRPAVPPASWGQFLDAFATELRPLET